MKEYKYLDYHCHLFDFTDQELEEVYINTKKNKTFVVTAGTGEKDNQRTLEIARKYNYLATIGIDPANLNSSVEKLEKQIIENKDIVIGIGEVGIDLYWRKDNLKQQTNVFLEMVDLSIKYNLPLIIHTREAENELYDILKPYKGKIKGVLHSYQGSLELAKKFIDEFDFLIGITGVCTYKNDIIVKRLIEEIDINYLLTETDSPYLNPQKYRIYKPIRLKNQPAFVEEVLFCIAKIKKLSYKDTSDKIFNNFKRLFNL